MEKPVKHKYPTVKTVADHERIGMVKEIFSTITDKYDFLNHLLSLRRDVAWRRFAIKKMLFPDTGSFLDVACGTGDFSIGAALRYPQIRVTGVDFVPEMIKAGMGKVEARGLSGRITLIHGDALSLPVPDDAFDVTGMAFGIRNIPDKKKALEEMLRATVPGGQIMILEMTFVRNRFFKFIYYVYLNYLLPLFAKLFTANPAAYHYLADSIMNFPSPDEFTALMEEAGMIEVEKFPLTFGITWLHIGRKPELVA